MFAMIGYIEMKALSKAGIIVYVVLVMITFFSPNMTNKMRWVVGMFMTIFVILNIHVSENVSGFMRKVKTVEAVFSRLETIGKQADDTPVTKFNHDDLTTRNFSSLVFV